jgi:hypothetical protein
MKTSDVVRKFFSAHGCKKSDVGNITFDHEKIYSYHHVVAVKRRKVLLLNSDYETVIFSRHRRVVVGVAQKLGYRIIPISFRAVADARVSLKNSIRVLLSKTKKFMGGKCD